MNIYIFIHASVYIYICYIYILFSIINYILNLNINIYNSFYLSFRYWFYCCLFSDHFYIFILRAPGISLTVTKGIRGILRTCQKHKVHNTCL